MTALIMAFIIGACAGALIMVVILSAVIVGAQAEHKLHAAQKAKKDDKPVGA